MPKKSKLSLEDLEVHSFITTAQHIRAGDADNPRPIKPTDEADVNCSGRTRCSFPQVCPCGSIGACLADHL